VAIAASSEPGRAGPDVRGGGVGHRKQIYGPLVADIRKVAGAALRHRARRRGLMASTIPRRARRAWRSNLSHHIPRNHQARLARVLGAATCRSCISHHCGSLPRSVQIHYSVLSWNMAVDLAAWIAVVIATARLSWRTLTCRGQFSLRVLFSLTTAVAIFLAWWRLEQNAFYFAGVFRDPETPLLRMLRFPPDVYIPLLFGTGCLILCTIDMTIYVLAPAQTIAHDLLTRTANTSPTRKRG
jgi:cation transport ATPase